MNFCMDVARARSYLEPKSRGASCREKNVAGPNMPKLLQALDSAFLEILKKFFFRKILGSIPTKFVSGIFVYSHPGGRETEKCVFQVFQKTRQFAQFFKKFH